MNDEYEYVFCAPKRNKPLSNAFKKAASLKLLEDELNAVFCKAAGKKEKNLMQGDRVFSRQIFLSLKELLSWFHYNWEILKKHHNKLFLRYINYFVTFAWLVKEYKKTYPPLKKLLREFQSSVVDKIMNSKWKQYRKDDGYQWEWKKSMADIGCMNGKLSRPQFQGFKF